MLCFFGTTPLAVAAAQAGAAAVWPVGTAFSRFENGKIFFKSPNGTPATEPLSVPLHDVQFLGFLYAAKGSTPYMLLSGRPCPGCAQEQGLYIVRANGGRISSFVSPGKITDPKTGVTLFQARSFYGHCLKGRGDVYVVFQTERIDKKRNPQPSVFVAEPGPNMLEEQLVERRLPRLNDTLKQVRNKECFEVQGRSRMMLKKPLDLSPRYGTDDADDDDESPKENQTDEDLNE